MKDVIREAFERDTVPNFFAGEHMLEVAKQRFSSGLYMDNAIEDHWNTFQEGWEAAVNFLKKKQNTSYTDIARGQLGMGEYK